MDMLKIGKFISTERKKLNISQRALGEYLYVTDKAISKWERGLSCPDTENLKSIALLFNCSISEILNGERRDLSKTSNLPAKPTERKENGDNYDCDVEVEFNFNANSSSCISSYLFGDNLEHTRDSINGGISAEMLKNRKFAGKPGRFGCANEWYQIGDKAYLYFGDPYTKHADGYRMIRAHECNSQIITNYNGEKSGIGQSGLYLSANTEYKIEIVCKVFSKISLLIEIKDQKNTVFYSETKDVDLADFKTVEFNFTIPETIENAKIEITFSEKSTLTVGAVSLMPTENFHSMRWDVVNKLKEIGVRLLRWPGGNFAGEYNWKDGLLPRNKRAPFQSYLWLETQPHTFGYDFHEINIDDFIALCNEIGAEPYVTINPTWNTPKESAEWVEYCNGDENTTYGKLRIERGYEKPYNVQFWSLGNEFGYGHMEGANTPYEYSKAVSTHAKEMLKVSNNLILCSSGPYPNEVNMENLVAKFVSRNLLTGAGSFENFGAEKSLRVSPAGSGVLPEGEKWGMWSKPQWATNPNVEGGYECESTNGSMVVAAGAQIGIKYLSSLSWNDETQQYTSSTDITTLTPLDGNKMLRIAAPFRSAVRKIDNLKPNTNYTLSFYVWNSDRWNALHTAVITDTLELETYKLTSANSKTYASFDSIMPAKDTNESGLDAKHPVREWQKITFNFTTDDNDEYLYLHLGLTRKDVSGASGFIYIDNLICYENVFGNIGNAIRAKDSALRYKYSVANEYLNGYYEGSSVKKLGLIVAPTEDLNGALVLGNEYVAKEVTENNYQYVDGDQANTYFTAALYNIGKKGGKVDYEDYAKDFSVRPYFVYQREDGTEFIIYGDTVTANIFDVMYTIKLNGTSKEDMQIVDAMLSNDALYEVYQNYQDKNSFYIDKSHATDYAYSMAVLGDIQTTNYYYRDKLNATFDWIIDNKDAKNIQYVFGLGDITDMSTEAEFLAAKEQLLRIQNAGIEQSINRGNHDWSYNNYITYDTFGSGLVSYDGTMRSTYRLTTIGGVKYMMMSLDFFPNDDIIAWASEAIEAHPDYNVILTTHGYFDDGMVQGDGNLLQDEDIQWVDNPATANSGQDIFDKLVNKHSNIVLLLCGHEIPVDHGPSYEVTTRDGGSKVVQMMVNHQHLEYYSKQSYGMVAMLYFSNDGGKVQLEYFSAVNGMYYMEKFQQEFELDVIK